MTGETIDRKKSATNPANKKNCDEFDVEKTRYEVLKFGITSEKHRDKRLSAKQQLLVSLGAKVLQPFRSTFRPFLEHIYINVSEICELQLCSGTKLSSALSFCQFVAEFEQRRFSP